MPDAAAEARIRDLKRRLELDPGSRLFVGLAEEYRKAGRLAETLSTLQKGLLTHPNYLSAQVALGRAYVEAGQITEAMATFSKTLAADPGNLVSAKSLADIYLSRGESVEAIKKYKLYRALSGDRKVDDVIERLEAELGPPAPPPAAAPEPSPSWPPPPAPTFFGEKTGRPFPHSREASSGQPPAPAAAAEPFDVTSVKFEPDQSLDSRSPEPEPFPVFSRDVPLISAPVAPGTAPSRGEDVATRAFRISEILAPSEGEPEPSDRPSPGPAAQEEEAVQHAAGAEPTDAGPEGRILADLYFVQGHYAEALRIYDDLLATNPADPELRRLRRDAEARLLPAGSAAAADRGLERRLAKVRALKRWLGVVQTG